MEKTSHTIKDITEILDYSPDGTGRFKFPLNYKSKVIHFPKNKYIRPHRHTLERIYKIIISGKIQYGVKDGNKEQIFIPGQVAYVEGNTIYDSLILEESKMILWEPIESETLDEN